MLGTKRGQKIDQYFSEYVVFDLETTGISSRIDKVVEISAIKVEKGQIAGEFTSLVNPGCPIPYAASQVNGITDEMVKEAPAFDKVLAEFLDFVGDRVLVGHNIHTFDMNFIYRDCEAFWGKIPENDYVDTLGLARICLPRLKHHKLADLAEHYGISTDGAHRALNDCRMNQIIYEHLGVELEKAQEYLKKCPRCGKFLLQRNGRYGCFLGCSGYPVCRYTENL